MPKRTGKHPSSSKEQPVPCGRKSRLLWEKNAFSLERQHFPAVETRRDRPERPTRARARHIRLVILKGVETFRARSNLPRRTGALPQHKRQRIAGGLSRQDPLFSTERSLHQMPEVANLLLITRPLREFR